MFKLNIIRCQILIIIALLSITRGSALTVAELMPQHSKEIIRQTKSEEIIRYMNTSVDPCEDFYEFTCGNYAKYHPTSESDPLINFLQIMHKEITGKIKDILETEEVTDTDADRKVKTFYKSCLNIMNIFGDLKHNINAVIKDFVPMPVLQGDQWQENNFDWTQTLAQIIYKSGTGSIFSIGGVADIDDNTIKRLAIAEDSLLLEERSFYVDESLSKRLDRHVDDMTNKFIVYFGVQKELAQQAAIEMKDFEVALAHGMMDEKLGLTLKELYTLTDIEEMQRNYQHIWDFKKFLNDSLGLVPNKLYVDNRYVENALNVIQNTPKRVVANYLLYNYLTNFFVILSHDTNEMEKTCMDNVKSYFGKNMDNMIYRKYLNTETEEGLYHMWRELKKTFAKTLLSSRLEWIRKDTRTEAFYKLKAMKMLINSNEKNNFAEEFAQLNFNEVNYIQNVKMILVEEAKRHRAELHQPPRKGELEESFSPTYVETENTVFMTVASLQPYFLWDTSYPNAYNFARMGYIVGHEIVHGFDDSGREYDYKGNERDWWDSDSANNFRERTKCFVDQYKQYIYGGKPLPESPSQSENIADNGGLRLAYEAYLNWYDNAERTNQNVYSELLPGLNYTNRQLFFISFAHTWCSAVDPDYMAVQIATDTHTPDKFRVIGSLSNYDEFSKAFKCPMGSGMNPFNKCEIY